MILFNKKSRFLLLGIALLVGLLMVQMPTAMAGDPDTITPTWPNASVTASGVAYTSLTLTWTPATDDVEVVNYKVYINGSNPITVSGTTYRINSLNAGTTYNFKVEAGDAAGHWSTDGPGTSVMTLPEPDLDAPTWPEGSSLTASNITQTGLTLSWTAANDNVGVTNYRIYLNSRLITIVNETDPKTGQLKRYYDVTDLVAGVGWNFRVEAVDAANNCIRSGPTLDTMTLLPPNTGGGSADGSGGMTISLTDPDSIVVSDSDTESTSELGFSVDSDNVHFIWDFTNGLDDGLGSNLKNDLGLITLLDLTDNQQVALDLGDDADYLTGSEILNVGDFRYTKANSPEKLRRLELILTSTKLIPGHSYSICFKEDFKANNGATLGKVYTWLFDASIVDRDAPTWPIDGTLTASNIGPNSLVLHWPAAKDNVGVVSYQIYRDAQIVTTVKDNILAYSFTDLKSGIAYNFKVEAVDAAGNWSVPLTLSQTTLTADTGSPIWPDTSTVATSNVQATSLDLNWSAADDNVGVTSYQIYKYDKVALTEQNIASVDGDTLAYHVTGLKPNTTYTFRIKASDGAGNWSNVLESAEMLTADGIADTTAPYWKSTDGWVQSSLYTIKHTNTLTWGPASDNVGVVAYRLYENGNYLKTVDGNTRSYIETVVPDGTWHTFRIEALDAAGNVSLQIGGSFYTGSTNLDTMRPTWAAGTILSASEITEQSVKLTWSQAPTDNVGVKFYELWWGVGAGDKNYMCLYDSQNAFDAQGQPVLTYTAIAHPQNMSAPALLPDTLYTFWIKADDEACNSSAPLAITLKTAPSGQSTVSPTTMAEYGFNLSSHNSQFVSVDKNKDETITVVNSKITSPVDPEKAAFKFTFTPSNLKNNIALADGLSLITLEKSTGEQVGIVSATVASSSVLSLPSLKLDPGTEYCLKFNAGTYKFLKQSKTFTLSRTYAWTFTTPASDKEAPTWPTAAALTTEKLAPTSVNLIWPEATDIQGVTGYKLYQDGSLLASLDKKTRSHTITGLTPKASYTFSVQAGDLLDNWSTDGPSVQLTTPETDTLDPTWPEGSSLTASNIAASGLTLTWTPAKDYYEVKGYKVFQDGKEIASVNGTTYNTAVTKLNGNTTYIFKVEAVDEAGNWSSDGPSLTQVTALDTTVPTWPNGSNLNITGTPQPNSLTLLWTAAQDDVGVVGYTVYRVLADGKQDEIGTTTGPTATIFDVTGLTEDTQYTFKVEARDADGNISKTGPTLIQWTPPTNPVITPGKKLAAGSEFVVTLKNDGTVWAWGRNTEGELGDNTLINRTAPVPVIGLHDIKAVTTGNRHGVALANDGTVWTWGSNEYGQLGSGQSGVNTVSSKYYTSTMPAQVPGMSDVVAIAAGTESTLALEKDGTIWMWGKDVGSTPVQLPALDGVVNLGAGLEHVRAIRSDKTAWYLEINSNQVLKWKQIPGAGYTAVTSYVSGNVFGTNYNTMLLKNDGTVYVLQADPNFNNFATLTQTMTTDGTPLSNVVAIANAGCFKGVVKDDGTVWTWTSRGGLNDFGVLGCIGYPTLPNQVAGVNGIIDIAVGDPHMHVLKNDGTIYSWGANGLGQLGNGTTNNTSGPNPVVALFNPNTTVDLTYAIVSSEGSQIRVAFNKQMAAPGSGAAGFTVSVDGDNDPVSAVEVNPADPYQLILTLTTPVARGSAVSLSYAPGSIRAASGEVLASFSNRWVSNNLAAGIYSQSPQPDATGVDNYAPVKIKFSKQMDPASITGATVTLTKGGSAVPASVSYDAVNNTVTLTAQNRLDYGTTYTVTVSKQVADAEHLNLASDYSFNFTTRSLISTFSPNSNTPVPSGIVVNADLTVSFVQPVDSQTLGGIVLEKLDDKGDVIGSTTEVVGSLSADGKYLTLSHSAALDYGAKYRLTLPATLADTQGCVLGDVNSIEFCTTRCQLSEQPVLQQNGAASSTIKPNLNYSFSTTLSNLSSTQQDAKVRMVVRGGKGARYDHGGTILGNYLKNSSIAAGSSDQIAFSEFSITDEITGNVYVDVYVWDSNGLYPAARAAHYEFPVVN